MKIIKNTSMQGLTLHFSTEDGVKHFFLKPKESVEVPDNWKSKIAENLVHRRMVKIIRTPDPLPTPTTKVKKTNKSN